VGYTIGKRFRFEASHQLDHLPEGHKCRNLHGHNYVVEVILQRDELDQYGFVEDFGDVSAIVKGVLDRFDHTHLNDVLTIPPTAENLALTIFQRLCGSSLSRTIVAVRVWETPDAWAEIKVKGA